MKETVALNFLSLSSFLIMNDSMIFPFDFPFVLSYNYFPF